MPLTAARRAVRSVSLSAAGLWTVCFDKFQERLRLYDTEFSGCRWVLDEEYQIIDYLVRPRECIPITIHPNDTAAVLAIVS